MKYTAPAKHSATLTQTAVHPTASRIDTSCDLRLKTPRSSARKNPIITIKPRYNQALGVSWVGLNMAASSPIIQGSLQSIGGKRAER